MSESFVSDVSVTYAVVELSNKKKKKIHVQERVEESPIRDTVIPLYAVVDKTNKLTATPEKTTDTYNDSSAACDIDREEKSERPVNYLEKNTVPSIKSSFDELAHIKSTKSDSITSPRKILTVLLLLVVAVLAVCAVIACLVLALVQISAVRLEIASLQQQAQSTNRKVVVLDQQKNITQKLFNSFQGLFPTIPASSCAAVLQNAPLSSSGYYWIKSSNDFPVSVYCDMNITCGNITGGWMRVAELDNMSSLCGTNRRCCPTGFTFKTVHRRQTCVQSATTANCSSLNFSTFNLKYSRVCGKFRGYKSGSPNGFIGYNGIRSDATIDSNYVDGMSLTHGISPNRQHIWTFAAGSCPCIHKPQFVRNDFFCDNATKCNITAEISCSLWDGTGCQAINPQWFYKELPWPTTNDIEMRVCRDQNRTEEDIHIDSSYIFVQ